MVRISALSLLFLTFAGACASFQTSKGGPVGTNGWRQIDTRPNEYIHVERPGGEVEIKSYDYGRYSVRTHRPEGEVTVPIYPNSNLEDTQERGLWINRIYRIPGEPDFGKVYRWYMDYFAFSSPPQ